MLNFPSNLVNVFQDTTSKPVFLLEMEYNAGGSNNTLRLAEKDLICGGYHYYGALLSIGEIQQSADIVDFSTSTGNTRIKVANTPGTIWGKRFSELFATCNFINRPWRLYMWEESLSSTDKVKIGEGYITSDVETTDEYCQITLIDYSGKYSRRLPVTIIDAETYPNAPKNNFGKPIPMFFGDMDVDPNAPTTTCEFDRYFTYGKVPALITNQWSETDAAIHCYPDTGTMKQLRTKNVFLGKEKYYIACEDSNVTVTGNPKITFGGNVWRMYVKLLASNLACVGVTNPENAFDNDFLSYATMQTISDNYYHSYLYARIGKLPNLGAITAIYFLAKIDNYVSVPDTFRINTILMNPGWNNGNQCVNITSLYTSDKLSRWNLEKDIYIHIDGEESSAETSCRVYEMGIEIEFSPSESFIAKKYMVAENRRTRELRARG